VVKQLFIFSKISWILILSIALLLDILMYLASCGVTKIL